MYGIFTYIYHILPLKTTKCRYIYHTWILCVMEPLIFAQVPRKRFKTQLCQALWPQLRWKPATQHCWAFLSSPNKKVTPSKTNRLEPETRLFEKGTSSSIRFHDFGFKMLVLEQSNGYFPIFPAFRSLLTNGIFRFSQLLGLFGELFPA